MANGQVLNTCACGLTYNPETSNGSCPAKDCGVKRSISRAPGESQADWDKRLGLPGGKEAQHSSAREIPAEG